MGVVDMLRQYTKDTEYKGKLTLYQSDLEKEYKGVPSIYGYLNEKISAYDKSSTKLSSEYYDDRENQDKYNRYDEERNRLKDETAKLNFIKTCSNRYFFIEEFTDGSFNIIPIKERSLCLKSGKAIKDDLSLISMNRYAVVVSFSWQDEVINLCTEGDVSFVVEECGFVVVCGDINESDCRRNASLVKGITPKVWLLAPPMITDVYDELDYPLNNEGVLANAFCTDMSNGVILYANEVQHAINVLDEKGISFNDKACGIASIKIQTASLGGASAIKSVANAVLLTQHGVASWVYDEGKLLVQTVCLAFVEDIFHANKVPYTVEWCRY